LTFPSARSHQERQLQLKNCVIDTEWFPLTNMHTDLNTCWICWFYWD